MVTERSRNRQFRRAANRRIGGSGGGSGDSMINPVAPLRPLLLVLALIAAPLTDATAEDAPRGQGPGLLALLPDQASATRTATFDGRPFSYRVEAGTLPLREGNGTITAAIFSVAYTADPPKADRPVTFVFNGGPGA